MVTKFLYLTVGVLSLSVLASFFAHAGWFLDLFSHFVIQYLYLGIFLGFVALLFQHTRLATVAFICAILSFAETRLVLEHPLQFMPYTAQASISGEQPAFTVVQYNHYIGRKNFGSLERWLKNDNKDTDIVVLQEATADTALMAKRLEEEYPYQFYSRFTHVLGVVILSKHPIVNEKVFSLPGAEFENFLVQFGVQHPMTQTPVQVYALHATPPINTAFAQQRNMVLAKAAEHVAKDRSPFVLWLGDWNITPFSPYFNDIKKVSGLNYQAFGWSMNATWPAFTHFPVLRIPIDHILYSDSLALLKKEVGGVLASDHLPSKATFTFLSP